MFSVVCIISDLRIDCESANWTCRENWPLPGAFNTLNTSKEFSNNAIIVCSIIVWDHVVILIPHAFFKCQNYQWNAYTGQTFRQLPLKTTWIRCTEWVNELGKSVGVAWSLWCTLLCKRDYLSKPRSLCNLVFVRQNLRQFLCNCMDTYTNHMTSSLGEH